MLKSTLPRLPVVRVAKVKRFWRLKANPCHFAPLPPCIVLTDWLNKDDLSNREQSTKLNRIQLNKYTTEQYSEMADIYMYSVMLLNKAHVTRIVQVLSTRGNYQSHHTANNDLPHSWKTLVACGHNQTCKEFSASLATLTLQHHTLQQIV